MAAVTVAICLHNSSRFLDETLESVFAQTFTDFDLLLVDDGSTNGCADDIERRFRDPRLRILRRPHRGLGAARQLCVAEATAPYVAFLDHDDVWTPEKLERQLQVARTEDADLVFSDCLLIDPAGRPLGSMSDQYDFSAIDLSPAIAQLELLRRGCFIVLSSAFARTGAIKEIGGFNPRYRFVEDYDLWLRLARRHRIAYVPATLASWRMHENRFTRRHPEVGLAELTDLLTPVLETASYSKDLRRIVAENLFGQQREVCRQLARRRNVPGAIRAGLGLWRYRGCFSGYARHRLRDTPLGPAVTRAKRLWLDSLDWMARARARIPIDRPDADRLQHVWIDGSSLGGPQTGYFNLVAEIIRSLIEPPVSTRAVHVVTDEAGRAALVARLADSAAGLRVHARNGSPPLSEPHGSPPDPDTVEVLVWRGSFRWTTSRHVAIVQDLTTRIHPDLHPEGTVKEFDAFLRYVERHADSIATVSEQSRRDIVDRLAVRPGSVSIIPEPVHPQYIGPRFDRWIPASYGLATPYVLCVGTIEPRKNLRRLVRAFERIVERENGDGHVLALAGPPGWDPAFEEFVNASRVRSRVRMLGFVPLEHLPSLYRFASAVVYPSVYEGFGLPVLEAMCSSAVVLTSSASALPEVLGPGGIQFDPYSTEDIAESLHTTLCMPECAAAEYRRRCRATAEALLDRWRSWPPLPGLSASGGAGS